MFVEVVASHVAADGLPHAAGEPPSGKTAELVSCPPFRRGEIGMNQPSSPPDCWSRVLRACTVYREWWGLGKPVEM